MPKVSTIITTYNRSNLLSRALRSILEQTYQDFEILIVDDASEDDTPQVVAQFTDPRIRYFRHDVNRGEAETRNTGIRNAKGEYIAYLDDDDEWMPEKLERQMELMELSSPRVGLIYTGHVAVDLRSGSVLYERRPTRRGNVLPQLLEVNFIFGASALIRKTCFDVVGLYDRSVSFGPDYEMWLRIAAHYEVEVISEPLYRYSLHENRLTGNSSRLIDGLERILEIHKDLFSRHTRATCRKLIILGVNQYLSGDPSKARETFRSVLRQKFFLFRCIRLYLLSYLPRDLFLKLLMIRNRLILRRSGYGSGKGIKRKGRKLPTTSKSGDVSPS